MGNVTALVGGDYPLKVKKVKFTSWCICRSLCRLHISTVQTSTIRTCIYLYIGAVVARAMAPSKSKVPKLSETASDGCCKFCAEPEEKGKRFLICGHSLCMYKYYHIRCLRPEQIASEKQLGERRWYCPSCLCRKCFCNINDNEIIVCDGCDEAYHLYCLLPPRTSVPKGDWYCQLCIEAKARQVDMRKYEKTMLKEHRKSDRAMVKSNKYLGFELLLSASDEVEKEAAIVENNKKKKLTGNEEAAMAAEKPRGDEEAVAVAE